MSRPAPRGTLFRRSASMPGRMAAAMITPRKTSAITTLSFQSASAAATIAITTSVATAVRFAVSPITEELCPSWRILQPVVRAGEQVYIEERRHGVVLVGSFLRALALAGPGVFAVLVGWPATIVGAVLLGIAAAIVVRAVWLLERALVVLTTEQLLV